jgi:hypothetical protein
MIDKTSIILLKAQPDFAWKIIEKYPRVHFEPNNHRDYRIK